MTQSLTTQTDADRILEVMVAGNLSVLTADERVMFYNRVCESLSLNPLTQPFAFITLSGKLVLYATKACTDQLRQLHNISISITDQRQVGDLYMVTVNATDASGRQDSDMGVVSVKNLQGENHANAMLKTITKAKRRVTLSICGLGMLDESEIADIPDSAKRPPVIMPQARISQPEVSAVQDPPSPGRAASVVNTATGELPRWTSGELGAALKEAGLAMGDLSPILGSAVTKENASGLLNDWFANNADMTVADLCRITVEFHAGGVEAMQPALTN